MKHSKPLSLTHRSPAVVADGLPGIENWPPRVLGPLARHLYQICSTVVTAEVGAAELTLMEYGVLVLLGHFPGVDQNTVADWQAIDRTTISASVQALEQRKLIKREVNQQDRRGRLLYLSKAGATLRARLRPKSLAAQARVMNSLTSRESEMFIDLLYRVVKANQDLARPGAGRRKPSRVVREVAS